MKDFKTLDPSLNSNSINFVDLIESTHKKDVIPTYEIGDIVRAGLLIQEGAKKRTQFFEGTIIADNNKGINKAITIRRVVQGIGIEKTILIHSPRLVSLEIKKSSKVRRAKLYFLRNLSGKASRLKERLK